MTIRIEVVADEGRLREVAPLWDALWRRSDRPIFQSPAWTLAWWDALGRRAGSRLAIGLAWAGDRLVAVAPFAIRRQLGLRILEWSAKEHTDYCGILADPALHAPALLDALWRVVASRGVDLVYLSHNHPEHRPAPCRVSAPGLRFARSDRETASLQVRSQGRTGEAWFLAQSKKARNNHRRCRRILDEMGTIEIMTDGGDLDAAIDTMIGYKRAWLVETGQASNLLDHDGAPLRAFARVMQAEGLARLATLTCEGRLVAGSLNCLHGDRLMAFFAAFDPAYGRASPGMVLMTEDIIAAFDAGLVEVDLLCGAEEYKRRIADASTVLPAYVAAPSPLGRAALLADRLKRQWDARRRAPAASPADLPGEA